MPNQKILIISDFSVSEVNGGCEMNDSILKDELGCDFLTCNEFNIYGRHIERHDLYIVSNFYFLSEESKEFLADKKYVIIEHDYKFLPRRNPAEFNDFTAPPEIIINQSFYQRAGKVIVQSKLQKRIFDQNLNLSNLVSFSANLWTDEQLNSIKGKKSWGIKNGRAVIMESENPIKGTASSIVYAKSNGIPYTLIPPTDYNDFLNKLNSNSCLIFMPRSPETLSRVVVEARMLDLVVFTNNLVGAIYEDFYYSKGDSIIEYMRDAKNSLCRQLKST